MASGLDGLWDVRVPMCGWGYRSVWMIAEAEDELTLVEQPGGSYIFCCMPWPCTACCPITHRLEKDANGTWAGKSEFQKVSLTVVDSGHVQLHRQDGSSFSLTRREDEAAALGQP